MSGDYDPVDPYAQAQRRSWVRPLILPLVAFVLGLGAMGYILAHWEAGARAIGIVHELPPVAPPAPAAMAPAPPEQMAAPATPAATAATDTDLGRRVAAVEQRIGALDTQSRTAVGNADRAENLLVAFAARRALDRGIGLGFLEGMLQQRFGQAQPNAVGVIIAASHAPVTLQELQLGLQQIGPRLVGTPPDAGWWESLKAELGSLITVRREGTPSPEPSERLRRATQRLDAGQVEVALAEVLRIPAHDVAADWIAKAQLYVRARSALDLIETAALIEPRPGGMPIAQPPIAVPAPAAPHPTTPRQSRVR